jgi:hypothetical protein
MNNAPVFALLTFFAIPVATSQCAIQPIKPIPPIGCKDVTPQCVTDNNHQSHWTWICVSDKSDSNPSQGWHPNPVSPNVVTPSKEDSDHPLQEPAAQLPNEVQGPSANESEMNAGEQRSVNQLRAIAEAITSCSEPHVPFDPDMQAEGFSDVYGPPQNVVWNVIAQPSIRARYEGYIEFGVPSYLQMPVDDSYCNKPRINKKECRERWEVGMTIYQHQADFPLRFTYEFDVTNHGLEFLRAFTKTQRADDEQWVDGTIKSDWCAFHAISSTPPATVTESNRPTEIPKTLWDSANRGESAAQYLVGLMYSEGNGAPQDYAEAYFWLDLAASGNVDSNAREMLTKARDAAAAHLTPEVLLETQKRARQWLEAHSSALSN